MEVNVYVDILRNHITDVIEMLGDVLRFQQDNGPKLTIIFFLKDPAPTEIYSLPPPAPLPISAFHNLPPAPPRVERGDGQPRRTIQEAAPQHVVPQERRRRMHEDLDRAGAPSRFVHLHRRQ